MCDAGFSVIKIGETKSWHMGRRAYRCLLNNDVLNYQVLDVQTLCISI